MPVSAWSTTAASNGATLGVDISEGCDAQNMNNMGREIMAQAKVKFDAIDTALVAPTLDATLTALAGLTTAANQMIYSTGVDAFAMTTLSTFARTVLDDGDAATMRGTIGAIGLTISGSASSGSAAITSGASTIFMIQWKDVTASANTTTAVTYPTAFASWSRAWVNAKDTGSDFDVSQNYPVAGGESTTGCTLYTSSATAISSTVFAIGV